MATNYYELLDIPRTASEKDIRAAYRRMARKYHPDVNPGDAKAEARFKEVNEAHQVLSDPEARRAYDRFGTNWRSAIQAQGAGPRDGPAPGFRHTESTAAGPTISDLLGGIGGLFGGGRRTRVTIDDTLSPQRVEASISISLQDAYSGIKRMVQTPPHPLTGRAGRRLEVTIPAGVDTGSRVHVVGPADSMLDLTVVISVSAHKVFERRGDDLLVTLPVPLTDAVLGGEAEVPTIQGGVVALKIPPETQNGRTFRLRGKGMPRRSGKGHGDLLATVKVALPSRLSDDERALFERLREMGLGAGGTTKNQT